MLSSLDVINTAERVALPAGYVFLDEQDFTHEDLVNLDLASHGPRDSDSELVKWPSRDWAGIDAIYTGVGTLATRDLVGVGVLLADRYYKKGELSHLLVEPGHRTKGLGKAIILERLRIADALHLDKLTIDWLEPTNTLPSFYKEQGFVEINDDELVRLRLR